MSRVVKRPAPQGTKAGPSRRDVPLPPFVPPQLSQPVAKPPSGPQWVHEIKLDGFRMAARIDNGRAQLLTRTGLDWTAKYPSAAAALSKPRNHAPPEAGRSVLRRFTAKVLTDRFANRQQKGPKQPDDTRDLLAKLRLR